MFYNNLSGLVRVLVIGPLAYVWFIAILRVTGKRTLAQLNAFDFIVTVALGSTLATMILSNNVSLAEGALALALLTALQLASSPEAAWAAARPSHTGDRPENGGRARVRSPSLTSSRPGTASPCRHRDAEIDASSCPPAPPSSTTRKTHSRAAEPGVTSSPLKNRIDA